jgi:hypothetical protein
VRIRGLVQCASDPELGEVLHIRAPVKIGEGVRVRNVAPKLGQHNAEVFGRLGASQRCSGCATRACCESRQRVVLPRRSALGVESMPLPWLATPTAKLQAA